MDKKQVVNQLVHRPAQSNKYDFGHVLVIGGAPGMVGAPLLTGEAALRTGAGLVTIASEAAVTERLERRVKEIMTIALPSPASKACRTLQSFTQTRHVNSIVFGPGLKASTATSLMPFLEQTTLPVVLDAGGLAVFYGRLAALQKITSQHPVILTPHTGEYQKLTGTTAVKSKSDAATSLATKLKAIVVLKGHHTIVARPDGNTYSNKTGNPGLATAGTGDVLAGTIAGLLAQKISLAEAAETGVYIHGLAGDLASQAKTQAGMIASDVIQNIPAALKTLI